jgi:methionine synthase II (cobalamin-independent)
VTVVEYPWPAGASTGIGSVPWTDRDEAVRIVMGEAPLLPHLPELPGRGAGSDLIGRSAAILVDLHVDLQPSGWRVVDAAGRNERRARSTLAADVDALEIGAYGYEGPVKLQAAGPLTLAAGLEKSRGDRMLADHGARRDLAASLAEGLRRQVADVARRVPGADIIVQLDEPSMPAVLGGGIPTMSGWGRLRAVRDDEARSLLRTVVDAVGVPVVVHCCAADVPIDLIRRAGAVALAVDTGRLRSADLDALAAVVDEGMAVWLGVVPSTRPADPAGTSDADLARGVTEWWRRLDQDPAAMLDRTVVTPSCGLAGADPQWAREAYALAARTAAAFADLARTTD